MRIKENRPNIVFCYRSFYPRIGGMENAIFQLAQRLCQHCNVYMITPQLDSGSPETEIISGIKVFRYRIDTIRRLPSFLNILFRAFKIIRLARAIYAENGPFVFNFYDLYDEQVYAASFLRRKIAEKVICSLGGTASEHATLITKRRAARCSDTITSYSDYILGIFKVPHRDARVYYPLGPKPDDFSTRTASQKNRTVLTVCRIHPRKNLEFLIEVASRMADVQFFIAGNYKVGARYYESLTAKIAQMRLGNVHFLGEVDEFALARLYAQNSIFFLPTNHEAFGLVFAEALSYGLPVVAPNHTAIPEAVGPGGILYAPGNFDECIKAIRLLLDYPERWREVSTKAKVFMQERFAQDFIGKYSQLLLEAANDKVRVSYAGVLPKRGKLIHGGRIKLSYLSELYPEQKNRFNILYLTSSARPSFAPKWVRICKKADIKIVWNQNGVGYPAWAGEDCKKINEQMREVMHEADWVIYQSEFCKLSADKFLGKFNGLNSVVYNCVDTSFFAPMALPLPLDPLKLLVTGTHYDSYRVIRAIETVAILRKLRINASLNIAGRLKWPGAKNEIAGKISSLGIKGSVVISGPYIQRDAPALNRSAHILLHIKYKDPCPIAVMEAMACGVPVVGSMSGGVPELLGVDGGIALKVPESWDTMYFPEPEAIAEAVIQISKNWANWSKRARQQAVNNFSKEKWFQSHREIFNKLIANG